MKTYFYHSDPLYVHSQRNKLTLVRDKKGKIVNWKDKNSYWRVTVAAILSDNKLRVSSAVCAPQDNFNRKKGRAIATARAKGERAMIYEDKPLTNKKIVSKLKQTAKIVLKRIKEGKRPLWYGEVEQVIPEYAI